MGGINQRVEQTRLALESMPGAPKRDYKPFVPGPNPELPAFIKRHATAYDSKADKYDVKAFDRDLVVDKSAPPKAIYDMHTYWSKKHWAAIREYIRHYLPKKHYHDGTGLMLDCFSGSGMTGVAAMMENRPCVLIDASPAAAFISHCYTQPVDPDELQDAYQRIMTEPYPEELRRKLKAVSGTDIQNLHDELTWLSGTKCDRCGGEANIDYIVYSERFQCPRCGEVVALFDCPETKVPYVVGARAKQRTEHKKRRVCPHCLQKYGEAHREFVVSTRTKRFGAVPVLVNYSCVSGCKVPNDSRRHDEPGNTRRAKFFEQCDLELLKKIERSEVPHWYPKRKMMDVEDDSKPWGDNWFTGYRAEEGAESAGLTRRMVDIYLLCLARKGAVRISQKRGGWIDRNNIAEIDFKPDTLRGLERVDLPRPLDNWTIFYSYLEVLLSRREDSLGPVPEGSLGPAFDRAKADENLRSLWADYWLEAAEIERIDKDLGSFFRELGKKNTFDDLLLYWLTYADEGRPAVYEDQEVYLAMCRAVLKAAGVEEPDSLTAEHLKTFKKSFKGLAELRTSFSKTCGRSGFN